MERDPRVGGRDFCRIIDILSKAIEHTSEIDTIVVQMNLGSARSDGAPESRWTFLLDAAAKEEGKIDELLTLIDKKLKTTIFYKDFTAWRNSRDLTAFGRAVADLEECRADLLEKSDPRKSRGQLQAMRFAISEIIEIAKNPSQSDPCILATDTDGVESVRRKIIHACARARDAVDLLLSGIDDYEAQSTRARQSYGDLEGFITGHRIVRHLLDDRNTVDLESEELTRVMAIHVRQAEEVMPFSDHQDHGNPKK